LWVVCKYVEIPTKKLVGPLLVLVSAAGFTAWFLFETDSIIRWSPYYKVECRPFSFKGTTQRVAHRVYANHDIQQWILDLSLPFQEKYPEFARVWLPQYEFPYLMKPKPNSVLIGGAGTGNDVAAALRNTTAAITAIEIDPWNIELGRRLHPEKPYEADNVRIVNTDMRSFLHQNNDRYDLVVYSILDSSTALSSLSSLRLDNYVYTIEGIREAVEHLTPDGIMCISYYESNRWWIGHRIFKVIHQATGQPPVSTVFANRAYYVFGPGVSPEAAHAKLKNLNLPSVLYVDANETMKADEKQLKYNPEDNILMYIGFPVRPTTDDWPFLFANPKGQPWVYYLSLLMIVMLGAILVRWAWGQTRENGAPSLDTQMLFLGAGFMLIETKAIAEMSLLFGSTWVVITFVFAGIFVMVLLANFAVQRGMGRYIVWANMLLLVWLAAWYFFPRSVLNMLAFPTRVIVGSLLVAVPLFFSGIVFASSFARRKSVNIAFGWNLVGAVVGGAIEATSLVWGIRALTLLAMGFYASAWFVAGRQQKEILRAEG